MPRVAVSPKVAARKPARSYFLMTRRGNFKPARTTHNQCKEPGYMEYTYELRMVFDGAVKLDTNAFIVDHQAIHDMVTELGLAGSCEEITARILTALDTFMALEGIPMLACRCTVKPVDPNAPAYLERIHIAEGAPAEVSRVLQCTHPSFEP